MTDPELRLESVPILDEVGASLQGAWRRHEGRRRRRARTIAAVAAVTLLAVPGAIAERDLTGVTPMQDGLSPNDAGREVPGAVLVAEGDSPAGYWRMFTYPMGTRRCVGLSVPSDDTGSNYVGTCELRMGAATALAFMSNDGGVLVFGIVPDDARDVDVQVPGEPVLRTPALPPDPDGALLPGAQRGLRYYVAVLPPEMGMDFAPWLRAYDATGRVIARLGGPSQP